MSAILPERLLKANLCNNSSILKALKKKAMENNRPCSSSYRCMKCFLAIRLWMVGVNMYDILGLLDICPCGPLHSIQPYISYKIKSE